ncbi:MAG: hypothetical protein RBT63_04785 [Bdellovibrionales bacterium]|jgi:hypothetical protein|nr:hypothetical protein [Bdellovibrionales bacterium]
MAVIYRPTDRLKYEIGELTFTIAPLDYVQKNEIVEAIKAAQAARSVKEIHDASLLALKYALKGVNGATYADGEPFDLKFDGSLVADESVHELLNIDVAPKLLALIGAFISNVPSELPDGVKFVPAKKKQDQQ